MENAEEKFKNMLANMINRDVLIKAVEEKKLDAEMNAQAHFGINYENLTELGQTEWEGLIDGWNDALHYVLEILKNED